MANYKQLIAFIACLAAALFVINTLYHDYILEDTNIYRVTGQYYENKDKPILFFGDSHTASAINPEYIPYSFNHAVQGESYDQIYFRLRKLLSETHTIEVIVLPLDLNSFSRFTNQNYASVWYWKEFMTYQELERATGKSFPRLFLDANFPVFGNAENFKRVFKSQKTIIQNGWIPYNKTMTDDRSIMLERYDIEFPKGSQLNPLEVEAFHKIQELAKGNDITIIYVKYPFHPDYLELIKERGVDESMINGFGEGYHIIDKRNRFSDYQYFYDQDHVNVPGSEILSKEISKEIESYMLSQS